MLTGDAGQQHGDHGEQAEPDDFAAAHAAYRLRLRAQLDQCFAELRNIEAMPLDPDDDLFIYEAIDIRDRTVARLAEIDELLLRMSHSRLAEQRGEPPPEDG